MDKTLQEQFDYFLECSIDGKPTEIQYQAMRTAFFAGAASFLSAIMQDAGKDLLVEEKLNNLDKTLGELDSEIVNFFNALNAFDD